MKTRTFAALALALAFFPLLSCGKSAPNDDPSAPPQSETTESLPETSTGESPSPPESEAPESPPTPIPAVQSYVRCTADSVNVRSGAGTSFAVLGSAEKGTVYAVIEKTGNWYKTYYRGKIAYLYAGYFSAFTLEKAEDREVEDVILEGYKLLGTPYVYGAIRLHDGNGVLLKGFTTSKFDCSSLVQYIFYHGAGELLQVTTRTQVKQGVSSSPTPNGSTKRAWKKSATSPSILATTISYIPRPTTRVLKK